MANTFRGELDRGPDKRSAAIHKTEGGFIVRQPIPFHDKLGPVLFNGRVFAKSDFQYIGGYQLTRSQRINRYRLKVEA